MTPRTCRLCPGAYEDAEDGPLCVPCWGVFEDSGEARRSDAIREEYRRGEVSGDEALKRVEGAVADYITRVLAEREVVRGRS